MSSLSAAAAPACGSHILLEPTNPSDFSACLFQPLQHTIAGKAEGPGVVTAAQPYDTKLRLY